MGQDASRNPVLRWRVLVRGRERMGAVLPPRRTDRDARQAADASRFQRIAGAGFARKPVFGIGGIRIRRPRFQDVGVAYVC